MRTNQKLIATALLWGLGMAAIPAGAQQPVTPAEPVPAATPAAPAVDQPLFIPSPTGATIQVEMDLRDDDLLGVFKSLLKGVGQGANSVPMSPPGAAGSKTNWNAQIAAVLSNADLSDVLKDVTHVHFVLFQLPGGGMAALMSALPVAQSKPAPPRIPSAPAQTPDQTTFYETAFTAEGGHRIVYINTDPVHVLMTSFGHTRGSAMMVQAPGMLAVLRADGYPDLSKLTALATSIAAAAVPVALNSLPAKKTP